MCKIMNSARHHRTCRKGGKGNSSRAAAETVDFTPRLGTWRHVQGTGVRPLQTGTVLPLSPRSTISWINFFRPLKRLTHVERVRSASIRRTRSSSISSCNAWSCGESPTARRSNASSSSSILGRDPELGAPKTKLRSSARAAPAAQQKIIEVRRGRQPGQVHERMLAGLRSSLLGAVAFAPLCNVRCKEKRRQDRTSDWRRELRWRRRNRFLQILFLSEGGRSPTKRKLSTHVNQRGQVDRS